MKTLQQCTKAKQPLSEFLKYGDNVDQSIVDYFIEVLPPITMNSKCVQMGEPYNHNALGQPQYLTLENFNNVWIYTGIKPKQ